MSAAMNTLTLARLTEVEQLGAVRRLDLAAGSG